MLAIPFKPTHGVDAERKISGIDALLSSSLRFLRVELPAAR